MNRHLNTSREFGLKWIMANAIAWLVGFGLAANIFGGGSWYRIGLLFGLIVGVVQYFPLRQRVCWQKWPIVTIVGWLIGSAVAELADRSIAGSIAYFLVPTLFGAAGGLSSLVLQYIFAWRDIHRGIVQLFSFGIAGMAGGALSGYVMWVLIEKTVFSATNVSSVIIFGTMAWLAGGTVFGVVTAFPLSQILHPGDPQDSVNTDRAIARTVRRAG